MPPTPHTTWRDSTGEILEGEPVGVDADGATWYRVRYDGGGWIGGWYTVEQIEAGGWYQDETGGPLNDTE